MNLPKLISFSGRKHSGKTLLSHVCCTHYGYTLINFADSLKDVVCGILGITRDFLDLNKDVLMEYHLTSKAEYISERVGVEIQVVVAFVSKPFSSIRDILQQIGTGLIREHNPGWHIDKLRDKIQGDADNYYCVGDCRFRNEKAMVEAMGGECWFILRPYSMSDISNHESEVDLTWNQFDNRVLVNDTTKERFVQRWRTYLDRSSLEWSQKSEQQKYRHDSTAFLTSPPPHGIEIRIVHDILFLVHPERGEVERLQGILGAGQPIRCISENGREWYSVECCNPYIIENLKRWFIAKLV